MNVPQRNRSLFEV